MQSDIFEHDFLQSYDKSWIQLEKSLNYRFRDRSLLFQALVHRSFANEKGNPKIKDNERLEFLGDATLGLAISDIMFQKFPDFQEGELSKLRSSMVSEKQLAKLAEELNLGKMLFLGKGEELTGGRDKPSLLSDTMEAVLAAVFLDGGYDSLKGVVGRLFGKLFSGAVSPLESLDNDFKTRLQEYTQEEFKETPEYQLEKETGPDHEKTFYVSVHVKGEKFGYGIGKSKKAAEQKAAKQALDVLEKKDK